MSDIYKLFLYFYRNSDVKIHMVHACVTYIQQKYFFQHSFSYLIYLSYSYIKIYMKTGNYQYAPFFLSLWVHLYLWKRPCWCIDVYNSYKIDHFDYSCDKFMKFEFFYEK
jgi:hypothetical protein